MYKAISLFSNAGIGDVGVENAGVQVVYANELLPKRVETYLLNHPHTHVECKDINQIDEKDIAFMKELAGDPPFLLCATPPCQGVSTAGKRDVYDIRNQLIKPAIRIIKELQPLWIWMENVPAYAKATIPHVPDVVEDNDTYSRIGVIEYIKEQLEPFGYKIIHKILDSKDYGVPQTRKRLIIMGTRTGKELSFPEPTHGKDKQPYKTVRDAIGHLERLESGEKSKTDPYHVAPVHNERHIQWMKATPEGQTAFDNEKLEDRPHIVDKKTGEIRLIKAFRTTYKRIWWDKPAPTVTMYSNSISSQNNVHPQDTRALTLREVMLLQSIPESFRFPEYLTEKEMREMVGEAVPCLLAEVITKHVLDLHACNRKNMVK